MHLRNAAFIRHGGAVFRTASRMDEPADGQAGGCLQKVDQQTCIAFQQLLEVPVLLLHAIRSQVKDDFRSGIPKLCS
jgi:hypothetical protein